MHKAIVVDYTWEHGVSSYLRLFHAERFIFRTIARRPLSPIPTSNQHKQSPAGHSAGSMDIQMLHLVLLPPTPLSQCFMNETQRKSSLLSHLHHSKHHCSHTHNTPNNTCIPTSTSVFPSSHLPFYLSCYSMSYPNKFNNDNDTSNPNITTKLAPMLIQWYL